MTVSVTVVHPGPVYGWERGPGSTPLSARWPPGPRLPPGALSGRTKLDDEIVELREWDAVRVPPGTWQGYEAGSEGLEILVIGAPSLGDTPRADVIGERDWCPGG